jgi:peptide/nickel transport system substrate-binding protein
MVHDTLFAVNEKFEVKPQMVDKWTLSDDKLTYTFTLRAGLKWHDGAPVKPADCIASVERWSKRDALGQKLADLTDAWTVVNDTTFTLKLKKPFALTLDALAKPSSRAVHHAGARRQDRRLRRSPNRSAPARSRW